MTYLRQFLLVPFLLLFALSGATAWADDEDDLWAPTPPRLSFMEGQVSYWRTGAEDWVSARPNLALAEGDALYTGPRSNLEVQFDSRSFARADENSQFSLMTQEANYIQFKVSSGLVSFDIRNMSVGDTVEVSTPNAVFIIEHPGYYRVEVNANTHFITRRGGQATVTTADGRSMSIYPSEDIVVTAGNPVQVATYAAPAPDAWDRWNDDRTDRIAESVSARYLPAGVYGAEELDHYGQWRVVPEYGSVWIPYNVGPDWVPYSTGSWVWDPHYEWTWIDDAPWGWAPFHYGRWVYIDGFWAWAPGPVVTRPIYSPALVAFMIHDHDVSVRLSVGLPGLWWVALSWGEPVLPWWGHAKHRGYPRWAGWGGPRLVNNVVINRTTVINVGDIHYRNARLPRGILTVPAEKFGRERFRATVETRYRHEDFATVRGDLPIRPSRPSLIGGAPRGIQPPGNIVSRPVVSTRQPRERTLPWLDQKTQVKTQAGPEPRVVRPPSRRDEDLRTLPRPTYAPQPGPERAPLPLPPRFGEVRQVTPASPPVTVRGQPTVRDQRTVRSQPSPREQGAEREDVRATTRPVLPPAAMPPPPSRQAPAATRQEGVRTERPRTETAPGRGDVRQDRRPQPLPGQPANQTYKGRDQESRRHNPRGGYR
jgi:hypothetical protein